MGIAQIALDPPPLSNGRTWTKSAPNHPGKPLKFTPLGKRGKKSASNHPDKPLQCPYMETTHFKKGLPLPCQSDSQMR